MTSTATRLPFGLVQLLCVLAIERGYHVSGLQKQATFTTAKVLKDKSHRAASAPTQNKLSSEKIAEADTETDQTALGQTHVPADVEEAATHAASANSARGPFSTDIRATEATANESSERLPNPVEFKKSSGAVTTLSSTAYPSKSVDDSKRLLIRSEKQHWHKKHRRPSLVVEISSPASGETLNLQVSKESLTQSDKQHGKDSQRRATSAVMNAQGDISIQQQFVPAFSPRIAEATLPLSSVSPRTLVSPQEGSGLSLLAEFVGSRSIGMLMAIVVAVLSTIVLVLAVLLVSTMCARSNNAEGEMPSRPSATKKSEEAGNSSSDDDDDIPGGARDDDVDGPERLARRKVDMYMAGRQAMNQKDSTDWTAIVDAFAKIEGPRFSFNHPSNIEYLKHMRTPMVEEQMQDLFTELSKDGKQGAKNVGVEEMEQMCSNFFASITDLNSKETWKTSLFTQKDYGWLTESIQEPLRWHQFVNVFVLWHLVVLLGARMELEEQDDKLKELVCKARKLEMECHVGLSSGRVPYRAKFGWSKNRRLSTAEVEDEISEKW